MTDAVREAFERWMSEDGKWPDAVAHRYGHYVLAQTESAWKAWQAALSEQPSTPTTPNASLPPLGDGPRKKIAVTVEVPENWEKRLDMQWVLEREIQADRWSWDWPQPAETAPSVRVPLTDGQILSCVRAIGTRVPMSEFDSLLNSFEQASQAPSPYRHGYAGHRKALIEYVRKLEAAQPTRSQSLWAMLARDALEMIATPRRPDGTWNHDRESCRLIAAEALGQTPY